VKRLALFFFAALCLAHAAPAAAAEHIDVTTYFDAPFADYRELRVTGALTLGEDDANVGTIAIGTRSYTSVFYGGFNVWNNDRPGRFGDHHGGTLSVSGSMDIEDASGNPLVYVDAATNRVGMGTRTPAATLDVKGEVKGMSLFAYGDPLDQGEPYAELFAEFNVAARISATYWDYTSTPQKFRYCTTHIDGNPLAIQSIDKGSGYTDEIGAAGHGECIIMGKRTGYTTVGHTVIFVVGEPYDGQNLAPDQSEGPGWNPGDYPVNVPLSSPAVPMPKSEAYAHGWYQYSSREYKKDIVPLAPAEYGSLLSRFMATNVVHYRLKAEDGNARPSLGLIAEEVPVEMVDEDPKSISLGEEASVLLAVAKSVRMEQQDLRRRVEELKKK
jgi:hypothetical protein